MCERNDIFTSSVDYSEFILRAHLKPEKVRGANGESIETLIDVHPDKISLLLTSIANAADILRQYHQSIIQSIEKPLFQKIRRYIKKLEKIDRELKADPEINIQNVNAAIQELFILEMIMCPTTLRIRIDFLERLAEVVSHLDIKASMFGFLSCDSQA